MMTRYKECPVVAPAEYPSRADLLHRHIRLESPVAELVRNALSFAKTLAACGSCRVKLLSGDVTIAVQDALTEKDKEDGYILTCQAKVRGDVKVDV